jgi:hypothetical protein
LNSKSTFAAVVFVAFSFGCGPTSEPSSLGRLEQREVVNEDPAWIKVNNNNIENLELPGDACPGDWKDLVWWFKTENYSPDLFLVQQLGGTGDATTLTDFMTNSLVGIYDYVIAEGSPAFYAASNCPETKSYQTNGIIFRTGRFSKLGSKMVWEAYKGQGGSCVRDSESRSKNIMQKFTDIIANKTVTVISLHWPLGSAGPANDPACAKANIIDAHNKITASGWGGDLRIIGGDANEPDLVGNASTGWRPWYQYVNGSISGSTLNYRDPVYKTCEGTSNVKSCLYNNHVTTASRIDFIFAGKPTGMAGTNFGDTILFDDADAAAVVYEGSDHAANYSDHRAQTARILY